MIIVALFIVALLAGIVVILHIPIVPIDETYTTIETYSRPLRYGVVSSKDTEVWKTVEGYGFLPVGGILHISEVIIENRDEQGGTFTVTHVWEDELKKPAKVTRQKTIEQYLELGEVGDFSANLTEAWKSGQNYDFSGYKVSAPKVQDQREVTRHRTHFKSIMEMGGIALLSPNTFPSTTELYVIFILVVGAASITGFVLYRKRKSSPSTK